jgi:uncharacterized protein (DUF1330 family)
MSIYVILDIDVHDKEKYLEYQKQVPAIIKKYGGRYLVRGGNVISLGEWRPERIVILEFPSSEKLQAFISCPEYQPVKSIRDESATSRIIAVEGCEEDFPSI